MSIRLRSISALVIAGLLVISAYAQPQAATTSPATLSVTVINAEQAAIAEHYSVTKSAPMSFVYLLNPHATVSNLHIYYGPREAEYHASRSGPWIHIALKPVLNAPAAATELRLAYNVQSIASPGKTFTLPLCMPNVPLESFEKGGAGNAKISIQDSTHTTIKSVVLPRFGSSLEGVWTANLPAVPSWIILERTNAVSEPNSNQKSKYPTGPFYLNFWGLVVTLIIWTVVYLVWAVRSQGPSA